MSGLYMLVGTLIALGVLVTFHEYGHFWVARRCGVKVLRFSVGFGTPLVRWHDRQGTEFVIAAIPLGGYVKMLDEREGDVPAELAEQSFNRKSVRQRIAIVAAGPLANFLLALLFFWFVAMLGSQQVRPVIGAVQTDSLAEMAGLRAGQEIVAVNGEATSGWAAVNLQLVRRLGESGTLDLRVLEPGSTVEMPKQVQLDNWLRGVDEPDRLVRWAFVHGVRCWSRFWLKSTPRGLPTPQGCRQGTDCWRSMASPWPTGKTWSIVCVRCRARRSRCVSSATGRRRTCN